MSCRRAARFSVTMSITPTSGSVGSGWQPGIEPGGLRPGPVSQYGTPMRKEPPCGMLS